MVRVILFLVAFAVFVFGSVNINSANSAQLQTLYGVGPMKAQEILKYRKAHGGFKTVDELVNVKGIGPKTMIKLRPQVSIR